MLANKANTFFIFLLEEKVRPMSSAKELVKIIISAGPNQGKSSIAQIIKNALERLEFSSIALKDTPSSDKDKAPIQQRMEETKRRPVEIRVVSGDVSATPSMKLRKSWLQALKNARSHIKTLSHNHPDDEINNAQVKELDSAIEELSSFTV